MVQPYPSHKTDFNNASQREGKGIDAALNPAGQTALHLAVRKGDIDAVTKLLLLHANPHHPDKRGQPPIFDAIAMRNLDMVKLLLEAGATFRTEDDAKRTPLMWAIEQKCDVRFLEELRTLGMGLDFPNKAGRQALHTAAIMNRPEIIEYLVKNDVPVDLPDNEGKAPLHIAAESKAHDALRQLLASGASPMIRTKEIKTALHIAAAWGDEKAVDILLAEPEVRRSINDFKTYAEGFSPLMAAVFGNHLSVAEKLIRLGGDLNQRDNQNRHSLFLAVEYGHLKMAEMLIRNGADVEKIPSGAVNTATMLHRINNNCYNEMLALLYAAGVNVDAVDSTGQTALCRAADMRQETRVKQLLEMGANPNIADRQGNRPIDAVMRMANYAEVTETVRHLLRAHADVNISPSPSVYAAPLHAAVRSGKKDLINLFLENGANLDDAERYYGSTPWLVALEMRNTEVSEILRQKGADITKKDKSLKGGLHIAASQGLKEVLDKLLLVPALAAEIDVPDSSGLTPLHHAFRMSRADCAEALIKAGANAWLFDNAGNTPLHQAVTNNNAALITLFEKTQGPDINWDIPNREDKDTALHAASRRGYQLMVERLLALGADVTLKNKQGMTPLHAAANSNQALTVTMLVNHMKTKKIGVDSQRDPAGNTALHLAVNNYSPGTANILLDAGADINARNADGDTALHISIRTNRIDSVRMLLARGADMGITNKAGASALDLATNLKQDALIALLNAEKEKRKPAAPPLKKTAPPRP